MKGGLPNVPCKYLTTKRKLSLSARGYLKTNKTSKLFPINSAQVRTAKDTFNAATYVACRVVLSTIVVTQIAQVVQESGNFS